MVKQQICPTKLQLRNLILGKLADEEESQVAGHVDHCPECQRAVEKLAPSREELLPLQVSGTELQIETREQALKVAMQQLHEDKGEAMDTHCESASDDSSLKVLSPCDNPKALGRLGTYDVMEIIGRGGMGTVFRAIDTTLGRVVAVKILSPMLASNGTARKRFIREARSAAAVIHDHVTTIHAVDEVDGQSYLVMQFVSGISLQQKLDRDGPLEVNEILRIAKQTAIGLAAAHEQGLVHRDIKPANILLENGVERVKITDFGLARAVDDASITQGEVIAGTPQYMAPEQANGQTVDQRADLFSLGSVMYSMCTGRPPFRAESTVATLRSVSDSQPRSVREINADIPQWLVEIIDRLHKKTPSDRFQSASEVAKLLSDHLARVQQPVSLSPENALGQATSEPRHRSRPMMALVAGLLFVAFGFGVTELAGATHVIHMLATVFRIETPSGTVVIEVDDPGSTVTLGGKEIVIGADGFKELRLKPGSYELAGKLDGLGEETQRVTVTQNSKEVVRIGFEKRPTSKQAAKSQTADPNKAYHERVEILRQRHKLLQQSYTTGNATIDQVMRASSELLDAELVLATDTDERGKILKQQLAILDSLLKVSEATYKRGEAGMEDVLAEKADRIRVETKLKRENAHMCPMHPQVQKRGSGRCPICSMPLIPASPRFVGVVECDVNHVAIIRNRFPARIERVDVDHAEIEVKKGDALALLQSPELYAAEAEYLQAIKSRDKNSPPKSVDIAIVSAAREKLTNWGITKEQLDKIEEQDKATGRLTLHAPASGIVMANHAEKDARVAADSHLYTIADPIRLWVKLNVSESDIGSLRIGQDVKLTADAFPQQEFIGQVTFIDPLVDPDTHTIKVRVNLWHPERKLKPGMTVLGIVKLTND